MTLNDTLDQMDLIHILGPKNRKMYFFFSSAHGTFSKIDHMLGHKTSLNKFKNTEIIPIIFPNHNMSLETNSKAKSEKYKHVQAK